MSVEWSVRETRECVVRRPPMQQHSSIGRFLVYLPVLCIAAQAYLPLSELECTLVCFVLPGSVGGGLGACNLAQLSHWQHYRQ